MGWLTYSRRSRLIAALAAVAILASGLVAGVVLGVAGPVRAASIEDHSLATYNMQGSNQGSKWTSNVVRLTENRDVVALQEAGARPNMGDPVPEAAGVGAPGVERYLWVARADRSDPLGNNGLRNVYFMETDPNGHRVNLAIVTPHAADQVYIIPAAFGNSRAAFGVRLGQTIFFTIHGLSGSGNDDGQMLDAMNQVAGGYDWVALGDFNREPQQWNPSGSTAGDPGFNPRYLTLPGRSVIYASNVPTHQSGSELDYAVASRPLPDNWGGSLPLGGLSSDHYPVAIGPLPAGSKGLAKTLASGRGGGLGLSIMSDTSTRLSRAIGLPVTGRADQRWTAQPLPNGTYNLVNQFTGQCLYEYPWGRGVQFAPDLSGQAFTAACSPGDFAEEWRLVSSTLHSGYTSIVSNVSYQCLDVAASGWVSDQPCAGATDPGQLWLVAPPGPGPASESDDPSGTINPPGEGAADVTWDLTHGNGAQAASDYDMMINALRTAAGSHAFNGTVNQTTGDPNRVLSLLIDLPGPQGQVYPVTLYFTAHDTRLRGWSNGTELFQFSDWDLGSHLNQQATTLSLASDDQSLRAAFIGSGGGAQPDTAQAPQRYLNGGGIVSALFNLYSVRGNREVANGALTVSTIITEAAHYGAVSHVTMDALGDSDPHSGNHVINDTEYALFNDWDELSMFARNVSADPGTPPLVLPDINQTLTTFADAANYVALIS
jgi:hypothetical protein